MKLKQRTIEKKEIAYDGKMHTIGENGITFNVSINGQEHELIILDDAFVKFNGEDEWYLEHYDLTEGKMAYLIYTLPEKYDDLEYWEYPEVFWLNPERIEIFEEDPMFDEKSYYERVRQSRGKNAAVYLG